MDTRQPNPSHPPPGCGGCSSKGDAERRPSSTKVEQLFQSCSSDCEAMDTRNVNNNNSEKDAKAGGGDGRQSDPMLSNYVTGRQSDLSGRRSSSGKMRLVSPDFPGISGTPTSVSQLFNLPSPAFSLDGLEFPSPFGSGTVSPLPSARLNRKRGLSSLSPLSTSSLDLISLIRTSPTSLLNCLVPSRGSSAGSMGHLSPALFSNPTLFQPSHSRPSISLRNAAHPSASSQNQPPSGGLEGSSSGSSSDPQPMSVKQEHMDEGGHSSVLNGESLIQGHSSVLKGESLIQQAEQDIDVMDREPEELGYGGARLSSQPLETLHEEANSDEEGMQTDPTDYSSAFTENDSEMDAKPGLRDGRKPQRIYYSYPSVEEPHNNHCRWGACTRQCEAMDDLVQHVNNDHIYGESQKEFVCQWSGCVRERRPFKAQYMLLVHMRRHTGEKPHKCSVRKGGGECGMCREGVWWPVGVGWQGGGGATHVTSLSPAGQACVAAGTQRRYPTQISCCIVL